MMGRVSRMLTGVACMVTATATADEAGNLLQSFPSTNRESAALVSEAMDELKKVYPISHFLMGGHSQGGFLTYSLLMNFPERLAGAFPISCGVIFQCEPDAYSDETLRKAQRAVPLAIVHNKNNPAVGFYGPVRGHSLR